MATTVDLHTYDQTPPQPVDNEYETDPLSLRQPMLMYMVGSRHSGKSYLCHQFLRTDAKYFNRIMMITPTFNSNRAYWQFPNLSESDVISPHRTDAINEVIRRVEMDRDEWDSYVKKCKAYKELQADLKNKQYEWGDEELRLLDELGFLNREPPKPPWWVKKGEEPAPIKTLCILDDVVGCRCMANSSKGNGGLVDIDGTPLELGNGLTRIGIGNRHVAPLAEPHVAKNGLVRSACGLALILLSQSYTMKDAGVARPIRENCTHLVIFRNRQKKQLQTMVEELAVVEEDRFWSAYNKAISEPYGSLLIDFRPKDDILMFRQGLSKAIIVPEKVECVNEDRKEEIINQ